MTETVDFRKLMGMNSADAAELAAEPPNGWYFARVLNYKSDKSKVKKTNFIRVFTKLTGPAQSFAEDEDAAAVVDAIKWDSNPPEYHVDYYITVKSFKRLTDMLDSTIGGPDRSAEDRLSDLPGTDVVVKLSRRKSEDGKREFVEITDMVGADQWNTEDADD